MIALILIALIVITLLIWLAVTFEEPQLVLISSFGGFVLGSLLIVSIEISTDVRSSKKGYKTWKKVEMVGNKVVDSTWYVIEKK